MTVRPLPEPVRTPPDTRSPDRFLLWGAREQWTTLLSTSIVNGVYTLCGVMSATALGAALDSGMAGGDVRALLLWSGVLAACALASAVTIVFAERTAVYSWLRGAFRTIAVVVDRSVDLGPTLTRRLPGGEVVAIGTDDISRVGGLYENVSMVPGALVSIGAIAGLTLQAHPGFGTALLVGVPLILLGVAPLLRPLSRRQRHQRDRQAELATRASDLVSGLRVLRGVGGEETVGARYRQESREVRDAGIRVGWMDAALRGAQALYPGLLLVGIVWYGAHLALNGELTAGQLVAFYGYTGLLGQQVRWLTAVATLYIGARVAASRVVRVLNLSHDHPDPEHPAAPPEGPLGLHDRLTGVTAHAGQVTGIVCPDPAEATALAERLGRYGDGTPEETAELVEERTGRTVALTDLALRDLRGRVLVCDNDAYLFSGRLRDELAPGTGLPEQHLTAAVRAAAADDVVAQSGSGLDTVVSARAREYSGGQQQRLRLARALATGPEVLVLVEPASAVDAHSEAAVAHALPGARAGRTTVVVTTSPLLLGRTDRVQLVCGGRVVAEGAHQDLLATVPDYARTVLRTTSEEP